MATSSLSVFVPGQKFPRVRPKVDVITELGADNKDNGTADKGAQETLTGKINPSLQSTLDEQTKRQEVLRCTEVCRYWASTGNCRDGVNCLFAHGHTFARLQDGLYKSKDCWSLLRDGHCRFRNRCHFLHNERKIPIDNDSWWIITYKPKSRERHREDITLWRHICRVHPGGLGTDAVSPHQLQLLVTSLDKPPADYARILDDDDARILTTLPPASVPNGPPPTSVPNGPPPTSVSDGTPPASVPHGPPPTSVSNGTPPTSVSNGTPPTSVSNGPPPASVPNGTPLPQSTGATVTTVPWAAVPFSTWPMYYVQQQHQQHYAQMYYYYYYPQMYAQFMDACARWQAMTTAAKQPVAADVPPAADTASSTWIGSLRLGTGTLMEREVKQMCDTNADFAKHIQEADLICDLTQRTSVLERFRATNHQQLRLTPAASEAAPSTQ